MSYPTTFLDLQNAVVNKLRLDATADAQKVKDWINQVYSQVCVETEARQISGTMALTAGSSSYTFPTEVVRIKQMYVTPVNGPQSRPLECVSLDTIIRFRMYGGGAVSSTGSITHYAFLGVNDFEVYPTPSAADIITIYYVAQPVALSAPTDVSILQEPYSSKIIEYGALAEGADFRSDPSETEYRQLFEVWMGKYRTHLARKVGNLPGQLEVVGARPYRPHDPSTDLGV